MKKQFNFLLSALAAIVQFGKGGGFLEWFASTGIFILRKADGSTLAPLRIAEATAFDEAVTLRQLSVKGSIVVTSTFFGAVPPSGALLGKVYMCRNAGGVYVLGKLYIADGSSLSELVLIDAQPVTFVMDADVDSGIIKDDSLVAYDDHIYIYDLADGKYFDNGAVSNPYSDTGVIKQAILSIDASGTITGILTIPANAKITKVKARIETVFDGTFTSSWAVVFNSIDILAFAGIEPTEVGSYNSDDLWLSHTSDGNISITDAAIGGGTTGSMIIIVEYCMQ